MKLELGFIPGDLTEGRQYFADEYCPFKPGMLAKYTKRAQREIGSIVHGTTYIFIDEVKISNGKVLVRHGNSGRHTSVYWITLLMEQKKLL